MTDTTPSCTGGTKRTHEHVDREYGRERWPHVEALIESAIDLESPDPHLSRVFARVVRRDFYPDGLPSAPLESVVGGQAVTAPQSVVMGGYQSLIVESVIEACGESTDLIVELGSGWGRNLIAVWLAGGPASAPYLAAEYTEAGRRAASRLAGIEPGLDLRSVPFDFHRPALSLPEGKARQAVVLSAHSIEQIPVLTAAALDMIRGFAARVTCLHFEPVGWQSPGHPGTGSSAAHAAAHDYNRNLLEVLTAEEAAGRLRVTSIEPELIAANPANATTRITWVAEE